jgi:hypothetical protein
MADHWIQHASYRAELTPALKGDVRRHLADALQGPADALPQASDYAGRYAWLSDRELVAYSDGSTWRAIETDAVIE